MPDVVKELGALCRAQQSYIHEILDEMEKSEGRHYDFLDAHLDRQILVRDLIIDLLEALVETEQ